jgi:hypothetical protein
MAFEIDLGGLLAQRDIRIMPSAHKQNVRSRVHRRMGAASETGLERSTKPYARISFWI